MKKRLYTIIFLIFVSACSKNSTSNPTSEVSSPNFYNQGKKKIGVWTAFPDQGAKWTGLNKSSENTGGNFSSNDTITFRYDGDLDGLLIRNKKDSSLATLRFNKTIETPIRRPTWSDISFSTNRMFQIKHNPNESGDYKGTTFSVTPPDTTWYHGEISKITQKFYVQLKFIRLKHQGEEPTHLYVTFGTVPKPRILKQLMIY